MAADEVATKRFIVRLTLEEREQLYGLVRTGHSSAQRLTKARILLKADVSGESEGWGDRQIVAALGTSRSTVYRVRKELAEQGLQAVLSRKTRETPPHTPIFDGEKKAKLIALAGSTPPAGFARWSLRLLGEKVVELEIVDHASDTTIGRVLKKTSSNPTDASVGLFRRKPTAPS